MLRGKRPDITPAQLTAIVAAAAQFLHAFGIYDVTPEQQDALNVACGLLLGVVLGDAGLRAARNAADAKRDVAVLTPTPPRPPDPAPAPADHGFHELLQLDEDLPTDDEEFAGSVRDEGLAEAGRPVMPSEVALEGEPDDDDDPVSPLPSP